MPLRWSRYELTKARREWTPQRLRAAAKAVQKEQQSMALFPGLARYQSIDDRVRAIDTDEDRFIRKMRGGRSQNWRAARRRLAALPPTLRAGVIRLWNQSATTPADPVYLLESIRAANTRSPWRRLRLLRLYQLAGASSPARRPALVQAIQNILNTNL